MPAPAQGFDSSQDGTRSRFSFANIEPINGVRYLFTFDGVRRERRIEGGTVTGHTVGGKYVAEDYQRHASSYVVDVVLSTPLSALPTVSGPDGLQEYWAAGDTEPSTLRRVPAEDAATWDDRTADMDRFLELVRGALLKVSFARHRHRFDLVLTGYNDNRSTALEAVYTLTFEHIRFATSRRVLVPSVPRVRQQLTPDQQAAADLELNVGSQVDKGTLAYSLARASRSFFDFSASGTDPFASYSNTPATPATPTLNFGTTTITTP